MVVQLHPETGGIPTTVALSGPREIRDWEEGDRVPAGYHEEKRMRRGLVIGGAVTLGTMWMLSALVASSDEDATALWAPVVGPWIQYANTRERDSGTRFILAVDGIAQVGGAAMLIAGIASQKTVLIRDDLAGLKIEARPMIMKNGAGAGIGGTF